MTNKEKLKRFFQVFESRSRVLIIINADPDAIGSALAVKRLLWRKAAQVDITYFNTITRPDNLTMIELTRSDLIPYGNVDFSSYDGFAVVDSQPDHHPAFSKVAYDAIIDHHARTSSDAGFVDIRPEYGACATLMTEYLKAAKVKPSQKLAAALMLGIKTDTADFTRQTGIKDIRAFQYLYRFADMNLVIKVLRASMTLDSLDFLSLAIKKRTILNNRAYFHKGRLDKPDELVVAADFFLGIAGVNWSVVSGVVENTLIIILRNDGLRKGAGNTAKEAFDAFGSAGGHKTMARAELSMSRVRKQIGSASREAVGAWIISRVEESAGKKIE